MNKKPTQLNFRVDNKVLYGTDPNTNIEYKISFCGNGSYSHYVLNEINKDAGWYVYVNEKCPLYKLIYNAEMLLVFSTRKK